jgi:murein tripeptide amidase MpaA
MNVTEVESALIALAAAHPTMCELITLPNATIEGRTTHAVRLGTQAANTVDAYYLTGGVHAREWGSCEILVNMAIDLCDAYAGGTGLAYGGKFFSANQVKALVEQMNIIIYPCVNPDGRNFSQTGTAIWRKNRNPAASGGNPSRIGVDINRNLDFLWDFNTAFAPGAINQFLASTDPGQDTYHGSAPHSEPETKNVAFIHDTFTRIKWYIDVHSYSEDILYVWGDDEAQVADTNMNFHNSSFNGQRGLLGDTYREFIPNGDLSALQGLAGSFTRALGQVRSKLYVAKPAFSLYATSGTTEDYAYSRHLVDSSKSKSLSFTVEWGTEFQPPWAEMEEIIKDVSAGLIGLGLKALGIDSFIVSNRDTFSSLEVETTTAFPESFYVVYDGFTPASLGVPGASPTVQFSSAINGSAITSISAALTATELENAADPNAAQRISFTYQVNFQNTSAFTAETRDIFVSANFAGIQDVARVHLIKQPNPYMLDGPITWLSTDVRVFQLRPNQKVNSSSNIVVGNPNSDPNAPYTYIQALLNEMRGFGNTPAPPFENIPQDAESSQLELSRTVDGVRVMNFAIAKVRYRANTQDAVDVRVFFRTFNTMVSDLSYTTDPWAHVQNYKRSASGTVPLLGTNAFFSGTGNQIVSIPYFAEPRIDTATQHMSNQPDNPNRQTLTHAGATEALQYFGCWLDFNQTEPQFPTNVPTGSDGPYSGRVSIFQLMRGIHACMVAEVRFQPGGVDPISNGATPSSSNRLSQRNLAIVESDNPGTIATHTVQHTLLMKPSRTVGNKFTAALVAADEIESSGKYDELVIRWNDLPRDTHASIYCPDWDADDILAAAATLRSGPQRLSKLDANTIACTVGDIAYIPIPAKQDPMPALLTLKLPLTVHSGDRFTIDVQQHSGPAFQRTSRQPIEGAAVRKDYIFSERKVLGAFRVAVLVKVGEPLLAKLVRNLAALRYIFEAIPPADPWHPVFVRYIDQLSDQVKGLGVDPNLVPASADDPGVPGVPGRPDGKRECITGKVSKVLFDCFGDFEGFVLETCPECRTHHFKSREKGIKDVVLMALRKRLLISVCVSKECDGKILEIIVTRS